MAWKTNIYFSELWRQKSQSRVEVGPGPSTGGWLLAGSPHGGRGKGVLWGLFYNPAHEGSTPMTSSLILITSQRPYLINITVLDGRVATHELEGQGTHKSSIGNTHTHTHTFCSFFQIHRDLRQVFAYPLDVIARKCPHNYFFNSKFKMNVK